MVTDGDEDLQASDSGPPSSNTSSEAEEAAPPKSKDLKWSDYNEVEKEKTKGIHAETAWKDTGSVEVEWSAGGATNKGGMLEATAKVTKITKKEFEAVFNKDSSYVVKGEQTDTLLEHERLHLQIAEYVATKALANFPEADFKSITVTATGKDKDALADAIQKKVDDAVDKQTEAYVGKWEQIDKAIQKKYDDETNHGKKPTEQADWAKN